MSHNNLHTEDNFWPCVSDMFLALFVIALALYSTANTEKGKGDEYISDLAAEEAFDLIQFLQKSHSDDTILQNIRLEELRKEGSLTGEKRIRRPKLAATLYSLTTEDCSASMYFKMESKDVAKNLPQTGEPERGSSYSFPRAVNMLYYATGWLERPGLDSETNAKTANSDISPDCHKRMRRVRSRIITQNGGLTSLSKEELIKQIEASVPKTELEKLKNELQEAKRILAQVDTNANYVQMVEQQVGTLRRENQNLQQEIERLHKVILSDNRVHVMDIVEKILHKKEYESLLNGGIEINKMLGVIRIPHNAIGFKSGGFRMREGLEIESEREFENKLTDGSLKRMQTLASFLREIADKVYHEGIPIDNIAIECHADPNTKTKDGKQVSTYYNDGLSLKRAFGMWRWLDSRTGGKLSTYKNKGGLGLFSLSGFGSRVPILDAAGHADNDQSRRIEIRFNCSPTKENIAN